jgi:hypothetical protein
MQNEGWRRGVAARHAFYAPARHQCHFAVAMSAAYASNRASMPASAAPLLFDEGRYVRAIIFVDEQRPNADKPVSAAAPLLRSYIDAARTLRQLAPRHRRRLYLRRTRNASCDAVVAAFSAAQRPAVCVIICRHAACRRRSETSMPLQRFAAFC